MAPGMSSATRLNLGKKASGRAVWQIWASGSSLDLSRLPKLHVASLTSSLKIPNVQLDGSGGHSQTKAEEMHSGCCFAAEACFTPGST